MNQRAVGSGKEQLAAEYLKASGYQILEMNYKSRHGEIDIIAVCPSCLVFAEVKFRNSDRFGMPAEAVNWKKQRKICSCARTYLYEHHYPEDTKCRFDVISILGDQIQLIENAFGEK